MAKVNATDAMRDCVFRRLRRTARALARRYDEALRPLGIKATQFTLLVAIEVGGRNSLSRLADDLGMERTTLLRNLEVLRREGLVALTSGAGPRSRRPVLTGGGRAKLAAALPIWRQLNDEAIAALGKPLWRDTRSGLKRLYVAE